MKQPVRRCCSSRCSCTLTEMRRAPVAATAAATTCVLPQPGGPNSSRPAAAITRSWSGCWGPGQRKNCPSVDTQSHTTHCQLILQKHEALVPPRTQIIWSSVTATDAGAQGSDLPSSNFKVQCTAVQLSIRLTCSEAQRCCCQQLAVLGRHDQRLMQRSNSIRQATCTTAAAAAMRSLP
jgi:hypothetical protein